jgi:hypothetical protein
MPRFVCEQTEATRSPSCVLFGRFGEGSRDASRERDELKLQGLPCRPFLDSFE